MLLHFRDDPHHDSYCLLYKTRTILSVCNCTVILATNSSFVVKWISLQLNESVATAAVFSPSLSLASFCCRNRCLHFHSAASSLFVVVEQWLQGEIEGGRKGRGGLSRRPRGCPSGSVQVSPPCNVTTGPCNCSVADRNEWFMEQEGKIKHAHPAITEKFLTLLITLRMGRRRTAAELESLRYFLLPCLCANQIPELKLLLHSVA